jgi:hypothetical protein
MVLVIATVVIGLGLALILWRELAAAGQRRKVGAVRDSVEVLLPIAATVALVVWAWVAR